jgi:glycerol-3-phosphate acyltransferase PlsY
MMTPVLILIGSYLLGAIPFGLLIAKWWAGIDVREHGSGNIGATNVYRVVGKKAGIVVFILDVLKGLIPPITAQLLHTGVLWQVLAGLMAILGHTFSPFLGFKGGKGVATGLGVLFGVSWKVGLGGWIVWGITLLISGYVSLGSILACISLVVLALVFHPGDYVRLLFCAAICVLGIFNHRSNIRRLLNGTESNFKKRRREEAMMAASKADHRSGG